MAELTREKQQQIRDVWARTKSTAATAEECGVSRDSVIRWRYHPVDVAPTPVVAQINAPPIPARLPEPLPEAGGDQPPRLPEPELEVYEDHEIDTSGDWLVISDIHIPYHDKRAVESALREAKQRNVTGIILNGDILDFYQISRFSRDPSKPRIKAEIDKGKELFRYLRAEFPRSRIVMKEGNHDERFKHFLADRAPELFDLDDIQLPKLLRSDNEGIEWVGERRVIQLGKLPIIHGHEYGGSGGVMPARWLFIRAWSSAMCGHFHQPSHFPATSLDKREMSVWSLGCACFLQPYYRRKNQWRHGFAFVRVGGGGMFEVTNREVLKDGRVV